MKQVVVLAIAVFLGIYIYRRLAKPVAGKKTTNLTVSDLFEGPDVDPKTGAYLPAGAQPGTVEFSAQGN